jgi:hypothetical protein
MLATRRDRVDETKAYPRVQKLYGQFGYNCGVYAEAMQFLCRSYATWADKVQILVNSQWVV